MVQLLDSHAVVDRLLQIGDLQLQVLVVGVCDQSVLFLLCLRLVSPDLLLHLVYHCLNRLVCYRVQLLADVLNADLVQHLCYQKLRFLVLLLLLLLRLLIC